MERCEAFVTSFGVSGSTNLDRRVHVRDAISYAISLSCRTARVKVHAEIEHWNCRKLDAIRLTDKELGRVISWAFDGATLATLPRCRKTTTP